jgi:hypothetical protein
MSDQIDTRKIAEAVSYPGIDPRSHFGQAIVTAVSADGLYCDIHIIPQQIDETATVMPIYGGPGWGFYLPVYVGQLVMIATPDGDYAHGNRIIGAAWDAGDPPPPEVAEHPSDVLLRVQDGKTVRMVVSGGGNAVIEVRGDGKVLLGDETATAGVARLGDPVGLSETGAAALQLTLDARYAIANPTVNLASGADIGAITAASEKVAAT